MRYCADTWFLIKLTDNDPDAIKLLNNSKSTFVIPTVAIMEFIRIGHRRGKTKETRSTISKLLVTKNIEIISCNIEIAVKAGNISSNYGIPSIDSIIVATYLFMKCYKLISEDGHYKILKRSKVANILSW